jgi:hypothetical protein
MRWGYVETLNLVILIPHEREKEPYIVIKQILLRRGGSE